MDTNAFTQAYRESRNGANYFVRHFFVRSFQFSDGVEACAAAGCFWLLDILATEVPQVMKAKREEMLTIHVDVTEDGKATITGLGSGDIEVYRRPIDSTDMPPGRWTFILVDEESRRALILPTEY
jgi:hypothetical protein